MSCAQAESKHEDLLQIEIIAVPDELVEPGDINLNFTIANPSGIDAQNVYLSSSDGLLSEPIGRIAAGETQTFSRTHSVSEDELADGTISYTVSHDDPEAADGRINYSAQAGIRRSDMQPRAEFTRQISNRIASAGSTLTITYRIRNTGNVALTSLLVEDNLGNYTGRVDRLNVGESRTLISRVTLTAEDVSAASLTYGVEALDGQTFSETLAEIPIRLAESSLEATLSANYSAFSAGTADVVLLLNNSGSADFCDVQIIDDIYGGIIADGLQVPAGNLPVEISRSYPVRGDEGFRWRITGVSETGESIHLTSETISLEPREIAAPSEVHVHAQALIPRIRRSGTVPVQITIENIGGADITEVILSEATLGQLHGFVLVPAGDSLSREIYLDVSETASYRFLAQYTDAEGKQHIAECEPVEITLASDGELPMGAEPRFIEFTGISLKIGGSTLFTALLIAGCAALVVLLVILLIASRKARLEKRIRIAAERKKRKTAPRKKSKSGTRKVKK